SRRISGPQKVSPVHGVDIIVHRVIAELQLAAKSGLLSRILESAYTETPQAELLLEPGVDKLRHCRALLQCSLTFHTAGSSSKRGYYWVLFGNHDRAAIGRVPGTTFGSLRAHLAVRDARLIANHGAACPPGGTRGMSSFPSGQTNVLLLE